jgi:DNA-binding MarR family transcriptional regulator
MIDRSSDVSRLVDRMANMQLVIRNVCAEDKRRVDVKLSEKGLQILGQIGASLDSLEEHSALSEEEAIIVNNLLDKMRGAE